jgi:hypothetical protein
VTRVIQPSSLQDQEMRPVTANVDAYVQTVVVERLSDDITDLIAPPATADTAALHREAASIRAGAVAARR